MDATGTSASATGWGTMTAGDIATSASNTDIAWATGTVGGDFTTTGTISPVVKPLRVPTDDNIPRKHKDKNGCVKKSWYLQEVEDTPFNITDIGGLTFNVDGTDTSTFQTTDHTL